MNNPNEGVSIVICCYNSETRIGKTLEAIARQSLSRSLKSEVIIVNNASTDNTIQVSQDKWAQLECNKINLKIIQQPIPGKSFALEKGISEAKFEFVIICDDDNLLGPNYINYSYNLLKNNKEIGAAGGYGFAYPESDLPIWWDNYKARYAIGSQSNHCGDVTSRKYLWGAGMITRKSLFLKAFPNDFPALLTCRKGNNLSAGGDSEYCMRLIIMGYKLFYDDKLFFHHIIPIQRLTESYRENLIAGSINSQPILNEYIEQIRFSELSLSFKLFKPIKLLAKVFFKTNKAKENHILNFNKFLYRLTGFSFIKFSYETKMIIRFARTMSKTY